MDLVIELDVGLIRCVALLDRRKFGMAAVDEGLNIGRKLHGTVGYLERCVALGTRRLVGSVESLRTAMLNVARRTLRRKGLLSLVGRRVVASQASLVADLLAP